MKKLALSVVALMVAGAGVSMSSVGCSSSSSTGTTGEDSGTGADVTTPEDGGTDTGTPTGDSSTPVDSGTTEATAACDVDAAGSIQVVEETDAGEVENTACEMCVAANCAQQQCVCLTDTNMATLGDASAPACGVYAICVYQAFLTALATSDAGESADLTAAQAACAGSLPQASITDGNGLIACIASACTTQCVGQ